MMERVIGENATGAEPGGKPLSRCHRGSAGVEEAAQAYLQPEPGDAPHERCEAESRPLRLLLAEPVQRLRNSMVKILSRSRYEILTATDGFEVLCRLPEWRPDILLMASELPRLGGVQVCSLLRQSPDFCALPVILLVDDDPFLDVVKARDAGASACLRRPFRLAELTAVLVGIGEPGFDEQRLEKNKLEKKRFEKESLDRQGFDDEAKTTGSAAVMGPGTGALAALAG